MLRVLYTPSTRELRLDASVDVFARMAEASRGDEETFSCDVEAADDLAGRQDPPADTDDTVFSLAAVTIQASADPQSTVALRVENPGLVIRGGRDLLALLARDFEQLAKADPGEQLPAMWFPGHAYLTTMSVPAVFAVTS